LLSNREALQGGSITDAMSIAGEYVQSPNQGMVEYIRNTGGTYREYIRMT